uniref:Radical SAM superfamily enzyme YgiQ, UPF0313 family n=1 Tax=Candidatus Kentrum sp. MB TaxID=2138164 RepID=A0A450X8P9_9GAMM|nr:MAG: Radical SAM superfamily enzyme YgiQ, UPF0313 family [Candidatus Kentron sp. MB]VFK29638.1 MAG: Radical SAM superfamily enzyme YgiQ, UPF0313 family [Candidatus Kentron sp. MB]VFK74849.1 MAG: Radical SAM superfamily enzyme YgiQ, UPF0313 family [Candidatus Kentron sp. MB]
MKILMISINKSRAFRPVFPVGMATVAAQTRMHGHTVACLDLCFEAEDERTVQESIASVRPNIIGISIRNLDSQNFLEPTFYLPLALQVVRWCRATCPNTPVLLGGAGFSQSPTEIMAYTQADYGIAGPGEESMPMLLHRLENRLPTNDVPGLLYWQAGGSIRAISPDFSIDLSQTASPSRLDYDPRYFDLGTHVGGEQARCVESVQTKKGCALDCIFCGNFNIEGRTVNLRPVTEVVDEIEAICARDDGFEYADGVFNLPLSHALEICREMRRRNLHAPWSCQLNPSGVTRELVELLVQTGCQHVEFGTDSGSDSVLRRLKKNFTRAQVIRAHQLVASRGIEIIHCVFIGAPGETRQSVYETLELMEQLVPDDALQGYQVYWSLGLRILENSELHRISVAEGLLHRQDTLGVPRFYLAPQIAQDRQLLDEIEKRVCAHANWYLWWGLPNIPLHERIEQVRLREQKVAQLYDTALVQPVREAGSRPQEHTYG